jgi:hypothetical protein
MLLEPAFDRGSLVGGVIVDDEMQVEIRLCPFVDGLEEAQELAMPVAGHAFADDGAVEHVESRKQGRGAVALVVMRHRPAAALLHRQPGLGAVEGLDFRLHDAARFRCRFKLTSGRRFCRPHQYPACVGQGLRKRNHSFFRLFKPSQISVRSPGSAGADQAPED